MFKNIRSYLDTHTIIFVMLVYAVYDGVYLLANKKKLVMDFSAISTHILPKVIMHLDVPLMALCIALVVVFDRKLMIRVLSIQSKRQMVYLFFGVLFFIVFLWRMAPEKSVDIYEVLRSLLICGFLEEVLFRGMVFNWLAKKMDGKAAMLLSGVSWAGLYGMQSLAVSGSSISWVFIVVLFLGAFLGTAAAFVYKKTDSLWVLIYVHAAICLF